MTIRLTAACAILSGLATAAGAETLSLPAGCEAVVTVQTMACEAVVVWTCAGDPAGERWIGTFDAERMRTLQQVDGDYNWLQTFYLDEPRVAWRLLPGSADRYDLDALVKNGQETLDFLTEPDDGGAPVRVVGTDTLTGESVTVSGETLRVITYRLDYLDGEGVVYASAGGRQFLHPELRIFLSGEDWSGTEDNVTDASPVEILRPGAPGFLDVAPRYGCAP